MEPKKLYIAKSFAALKANYAKNLELDKSKTFEQYVQSAVRLYEALETAKLNGDDERAFVLAMRYCDTYVLLRKHFPDKKDLVAQKLCKVKESAEIGEKMSAVLKKRYKDSAQFDPKNEPPPELLKQNTKQLVPNNSAEINNNNSKSESGESQKEGRLKPSKGNEGGYHANPSSEKEYIEAAEFNQLVKSKGDDILLLDLREEVDFGKSRLKIANQVNIPESFLKQKQVVTANEINMCLEDESLSRWYKRDSFEFVIFCDWLGLDKTFIFGSTFSVLRDCLLKWSDDHHLKTSPLILFGGFREIIDRYPLLVTNSNVERPKQESAKINKLDKLDINKLSIRDEPDTTSPGQILAKVPAGIPTVDRSLKPKTQIPVSEDSQKLSTNGVDLPNSNPSYPNILDELAKPTLQNQNRTNAQQTAGNVSKVSESEPTKPTAPSVPRAPDRSLKPQMINKDVDGASEISKLMKELDAEKEDRRRLEVENEQLKLELQKTNARAKREQEASGRSGSLNRELDLDSLRQKKPEAPNDVKPSNDSNELETAFRTGKLQVPLGAERTTINSAVSSQLSADASSNVYISTPLPAADRPNSSDSAPGTKSYVQPLRDDSDKSLDSSSGSTLKRTNSSPDIANEAQSKVDVSIKRVPSPRRHRKPQAAALLEIDSRHLRNLQPDYGAVNSGRCGLRNLGNTCYMNACLQCLSHSYLLREYILRGIFFNNINPNSKEGLGGYLVYEFTILLKAIWSNQYKTLSPVDIKLAMGQYRKQFTGFDQQDAQELLIALLDGLHEEVNTVGEKKIKTITDSEMANKTDSELANLYWENYSLNNKSIIVDIFQGQYRSVVQCTVCGKRSTAFDTFMYLSLPIPKASRPTLFDCFQLYCNPEYIEWNCPACKTTRKATKKLDVWRWPKYLIIHLKRFEFTTGFTRVKIQSKVDFPMFLLTDTRWKQVLNNNFSLYGVVQHSGNSLDRGHYVANVLIDKLRQWHKFDDSLVSSTSPSSVVSENAYLLFYASN